MDALPVGAALLAADGSLLFGNFVIRELLGLGSASPRGVFAGMYFTPADGRALHELLPAAPAGDPQAVRGVLATVSGPMPATASWTRPPTEHGRASLLVVFTLEPVAQLGGEPADQAPEHHVARTVGSGPNTEQLPQQEDLMFKEAQCVAQFEQSAVAQALIDSHGSFRSVNNAFLELVRREVSELLGVPLLSVARAEAAGGSDSVESVLSGGVDACQLELAITRSAGDEVLVLADITGLRGTHGAAAGAALILHDLTALRASEQRRVQQAAFFTTMNRLAGDLSLVADATGQLVYVSPGAHRVLGYDSDDLMGLEGWDFVHPDDLVSAQAVYAAVVGDGLTRSMELRVKAADGTWRWIEETVTNMLDEAVGGLVCNLRDVHEQKLAQQHLQQSESKFRAIAEAADEGIWAVDATGATLFANVRMAGLLGRPLQDLYDLPPESLALDDPIVLAERRRLRPERGPEGYEVSYEHPDLGTRIFWVSAAPFPAAVGSVIGSVAMVSDVTESRRTARELERLALHDSLTGIANRALFLDRLECSLGQRNHTTSVLLIDLDYFKLVNDSRGHHVGDALLVAVAQVLVAAVRPQDTVARLGGDEFVILAEDLTQAQAVDLAQSILEALSMLADSHGEARNVGASIGLAMGPGTAGDVLRYADTAMYAAKADGRGRVRMFDPALALEAEERYALSSDLRLAFLEDTLDMAYQPILDLATGVVVGMEALVRWVHPTRGQVPADRLVSVAELTGLSYQLDRWAIRRALKDAGMMRRAGTIPLEAYVAVNLTALNLDDQALEDLLVAESASAGLHPNRIVLEITESAVMVDTGASIRLLQRLRDRGFRIALDDFGTGHSCLAYLRDLPVTTLKVDRSFVANITRDGDSFAIAASILDLSRRVGLATVAEGVETEHQAALLRTLGCGSAQGWLWSAALSPAAIAANGGWTAPFTVPAPAAATPARARRPARPRASSEHGLDELLSLHDKGASLHTIAAALNRHGFPTPEGTRWHRASVARALADVAEARGAEAPGAQGY